MKILTTIGNYLPGYKAGGLIRSVANMVERLGDEYEFFILTSDRDLGDKKPYPNIQKGTWSALGKAQVLYLSPEQQTLFGFYRLLRALNYDIIYLNGCFSRETVQILLLRRLGLIPPISVVLAARGEFSLGALALKALKKNIYLFTSSRAGLYTGIRWHASSDYEAQDIRKRIVGPSKVIQPSPISVSIASDLVVIKSQNANVNRIVKIRGELHVVFLSRISRKKNLDFALGLLGSIKGRVYFDIYGPIEDQAYWSECQHLINKLPVHIHVQYCGMVPHQDVTRIFGRYHLFLFPTRGENFGHVILESFSAGCPVLTSDRTFWRNLERQGVGWDVPLSDSNQFKAILEACAEMDRTAFDTISASAYAFAAMYLKSQDTRIMQEYHKLFSGSAIDTSHKATH